MSASSLERPFAIAARSFAERLLGPFGEAHPDFYVLQPEGKTRSIPIERVRELTVEHGDLDDVIERLSADRVQDPLQLRRLKKRKLFLKDQIQRLRARLIPDIIA